MKYIVSLLIAGIISIGLLSCSNPDYKGKPVGKIVNIDSIIELKQSKHLAELYSEHGNFINTKEFPPVLNAKDLNEDQKNVLLIDIRSAEAYESGHINAAYNVQKEDIVDFITEKQKAFAYDKVVIICYSGQLASYVTGVLRYAGFDNTYTLLHGMAAWNTKFSDILQKNFKLAYRDMIVRSDEGQDESIEEHAKKEKKVNINNLPKLPKTVPTTLVLERARALLKRPRKDFMLKADEFFPDLQKNQEKYYIINYWDKKEFDAGHIKGAHLYIRRNDLTLEKRLTELPTDKPIVLYCKSGHTGGHAVAYLTMLGYEAYNLMFGNNGFKYNLFSEGINNITNDFPIVEGAKRTNNKIVTTLNKISKPKTTKPIIKRKKKEVSGGCG